MRGCGGAPLEFLKTYFKTMYSEAFVFTKGGWRGRAGGGGVIRFSHQICTDLENCLKATMGALGSSSPPRPPPYLPIGFSWDCSNDTRFVSLVEMSFTGLNELQKPERGWAMSQCGSQP